MDRFNAPRPILLLPRVRFILHPIVRHCEVFVTNFIAAEFRALYCTRRSPPPTRLASLIRNGHSTYNFGSTFNVLTDNKMYEPLLLSIQVVFANQQTVSVI
ncbi:hypothetical protein EVAR_68_1 [Eumeta japonica]|uniref:Uncharacterized protein n=1 Tax=Eumeta variegata TaxID=151549 RepID=A0A4C1S7X0_EUMVA|nr:hypothetical protein EVAR_68_1 [Eumeta japonica]